jgi:hypothetical protein
MRERSLRAIPLLTATLLLVAGLPAAAQNYSVPTQVIAGGGGLGTGGSYALVGTTGQPVAPAELTLGGTQTLAAGFWQTADILKLAIPFIDAVLVPGASVIRAVHITELRLRIDSLRARFGLVPYLWTDPVLVAGTALARAVHVTDLRDALSQAYVAAGLMPPVFAAGVGPGLPITVTGIVELRAAVLALE